MDDFQFWLYVIIGLIYVLSKLRKKPEETPSDAPPQDRTRPARREETPQSPQPLPGGQMTFEELLREISESKAAAPRPAPRQERKEEVEARSLETLTSYEEQHGEDQHDLEQESIDRRTRDKVYAEYEEGRRQAFARKSLEETMNVSDTDVTFGRFKSFEQEKERDLMAEYLSDLKDPRGLKKAFVLSEVLKRKF